MAAAPSCARVDCPAVWGWTIILHWQGVLCTVRSGSFLGGPFLDPHLGTKAKKHTKS